MTSKNSRFSALFDLYNLVVKVLSKPYLFLVSLASLITIPFGFIQDQDKVIVSLVVFIILLLILFGTLIYTILRLLNDSCEPFDSKSTFIKYETNDASKISYDVYKLIQCKRPILSEYIYNFKWSGTHVPIISSDLQQLKNINSFNNVSQYDNAVLQFNKPLRFNESCVVHFKAIIDDADRRSDTYISNRILRQVDLIQYRVVLSYKTTSSNAILERRKIDSISVNFEKIKEISFDTNSKSFEYHLLNPDLGYIYRFSWER